MKPTRVGASRVKVRDIKRGNRAATINSQITEVSIWTDFNIMPCIRDAVQLNSVKMTLQEKTLGNSLFRKFQAHSLF